MKDEYSRIRHRRTVRELKTCDKSGWSAYAGKACSAILLREMQNKESARCEIVVVIGVPCGIYSLRPEEQLLSKASGAIAPTLRRCKWAFCLLLLPRSLFDPSAWSFSQREHVPGSIERLRSTQVSFVLQRRVLSVDVFGLRAAQKCLPFNLCALMLRIVRLVDPHFASALRIVR